MKKIMGIIICSILLVAACVIGFNSYRENKIEKLETTISPIDVFVEELPVEEFKMTYLFDVADKKKLVGFVDYMFVAKVENITGVTYRAVTYNADTNKYSGMPYTCYEITVVENIKGNLVLNEKIPLRKLGEVSIDGKSNLLIEQETMPKEGGYYLFLGYADEKGELYVCDPNSTVYLGDDYNSKSKINNTIQSFSEEDTILDEYRFAYKNQDLSERRGERNISIYEVK